MKGCAGELECLASSPSLFKIAAIIILLTGCSNENVSSVVEGQALLTELTQIGDPISLVRRSLAEHDLPYEELPTEICNQIVKGTGFSCADGPAILVTLNEDVGRWNPFCDFSLLGFVVFDDSAALQSMAVFFEADNP